MRRLLSFGLSLVMLFTLADPVAAASIPAPVELVATGGAGRIDLWWQYGVLGQYAGLDYFRVYRSVDGGNTFCLYDTVTWTSGSSPEYIDMAPAAGQMTVYYVTAVDVYGEETEGRTNTAAAYPTSGGVTSPTCDGSGGGEPDPGGGDPDPGGGDPDPGGGTPDPEDPEPCDTCGLMEDVLDALLGVEDGILGVQDGVQGLHDYLQNPAPLPAPPSIPIGPGYTPPQAPDLTPVMPQLGRRTGRPAPTVPTLQVPVDIPAPPALPPIEDPAVSPWGLPIGEPGVGGEPLQPAEQIQPQAPGAPSVALPATGNKVPQDPLVPTAGVAPSGPRTPAEPLIPSGGLLPGGPLTPDPPLIPVSPVS